MGNQKQILTAYRDIISMIKTNLVRDLAEANSTGSFNMEQLDFQRLTALTDTFIDQYAAAGYEMLQRQTNEASTTSTRRSKK